MKKVDHRPETLPKLTEAEKIALRRAQAAGEDGIDTSDAPELTDAQLADMERGRFFRPVKKQITARVDADVLEWLKSGGKGYQSRMNAILRQAMLESE